MKIKRLDLKKQWRNEEKKLLPIVKNVLSSGIYVGGKYINSLEKKLAKYCGTKHAIAVSNNGDGFDMVLNSLNLKPNDEIIAPALNFKAWHMVLLRYKCKCVFVDIDPKTLNIDLIDLEKKITKKTKVIYQFI